MMKIFSNKLLNVWKNKYGKADLKRVCFLIGGGERAWTADQRIMSPLLLPTELHPLKFSSNNLLIKSRLLSVLLNLPKLNQSH